MYAKLVDGRVVPVSGVKEWAMAFEEKRNRQIGDDNIGKYRVSTVFLGLDHGLGGKPLWFETMLFGDGPLDQEQWRYETLEEAKEGHKKACELAAKEAP